MNIFFDVDATILGMDNSLRPGTRETFLSLTGAGHKVYIWSGMGVRSEVIKRHKLAPLVSGVYAKPMEDHEKQLAELGVPVTPDFVIDDDPAVVSAFGGAWVPPYYYGSADREMERVFKIILQFALKGASEDSRFRAKGSRAPFS